MTTAPDGGPAATSPAAMLADTIGRVAIAEHKLSQLGSDLGEIGARQIEVHDVVKALQQQIDGLQFQMTTLANLPDDDDDDETVLVDWSGLDKAGALREWDRLYLWLDTWLVPTYQVAINQLRPCWTYHARVREELSWLRVCWAQAYRRPGSTGSAAGEWHLRWLPGALENIKDHFNKAGCNLGRHEDQTLPDHIRSLPSDELSHMTRWLDEGRLADIERRR